MSQCERCGATNQPHSRFCVSCGSPMVEAPAAPLPQQHGAPAQPQPRHPPPQQPARQPAPGHYQPSPPGYGQSPAPHPQPGYSHPQPGHSPAYPYAPGPPPHESPNPFAETAGPAGHPDPEAVRHALAGGHYAAQSGYPAPTSRPPAHPYGPGFAPVAPNQAGYAGAPPLPSTAQMPGVSQDPEALPEGSPRILAAFLVSYETDALGKFWPIYQGRTLLGREGGGPVDIGIPHPTTSSRHAVLHAAARPGRIKVEDSGSTNGTFVNETRLQTNQLHELRDGDHLRLGLFSATIKII